MILLIENTNLVSIAILSIILLLVLYFYISYQKLKNTQQKKLQFLYLELESEQIKATDLKNVPSIIKENDKKLQNKLLKIRTDIMNLDFSLSELFS